MSPIELYNATASALSAGDHTRATELLPKLAKVLNDLGGRGWHGFPLTGDDAIDTLIKAANKRLG